MSRPKIIDNRNPELCRYVENGVKKPCEHIVKKLTRRVLAATAVKAGYKVEASTTLVITCPGYGMWEEGCSIKSSTAQLSNEDKKNVDVIETPQIINQVSDDTLHEQITTLIGKQMGNGSDTTER